MTNTTTQTAAPTQAESLLATGRAAYADIAKMVAALNCDYDRLEELRQEKEKWKSYGPVEIWGIWEIRNPDEAEELAELIEAAGDCKDREEAQERIQKDALTVEVRSDWHTPGGKKNASPIEFRILLVTGGPAVQIRGELSEHGDPCSAWLEVQDWGTPWTRYYDASEDVLLAYAQWFYFSE